MVATLAGVRSQGLGVGDCVALAANHSLTPHPSFLTPATLAGVRSRGWGVGDCVALAANHSLTPHPSFLTPAPEAH
jgi:hypothetical protein